MSHASIHIVVELKGELLHRIWSEGGVSAFNRFVQRLCSQQLTPPIWTEGEEPEPIGVLLDFSNLRMPHYHLDGIDLSQCWLEDADFTGASMRGCRAGCGRNVSYRFARLDKADFRNVEISGCIFTDSTGLATAYFEDAVFDPNNPPVGLPSRTLALCLPEADPPPENIRLPRNPMEPTGFGASPLACHASIHIVPTGNIL